MDSKQIRDGFIPEGLVSIGFSIADGGTREDPLIVFLRKRVDGQPLNYMKVRLSDIKRKAPIYAYPVPEDEDFILWKLDDTMRILQRKPRLTIYDYVAQLPVVFRFFTGKGEKDYRITFENADLMCKMLNRIREDGYLVRPMEDKPIKKANIVDPKETTVDLQKYARMLQPDYQAALQRAQAAAQPSTIVLSNTRHAKGSAQRPG